MTCESEVGNSLHSSYSFTNEEAIKKQLYDRILAIEGEGPLLISEAKS